MKNVVIGIDVGGSTTKIVGFGRDRSLIEPLFVKAADPITSVYGAFGKFTEQNNLALTDISRVMITGVGSTHLTKPIYGLPCEHVAEFESVGLGGLYLSGLDDAIIVSMGTGTAITHATIDREKNTYQMEYLGGTGVGGGTLSGLAKQLLGVENIGSIVELAATGDVGKVDLQIRDITKKDTFGLPLNMTASNFGKVDDLATKSDIAAGIINMVYETVGMLSIFCARNHGLRDIILTGNMTSLPQAEGIFSGLSQMFDVRFSIPKNAQFGTVIGAALLMKQS